MAGIEHGKCSWSRSPSCALLPFLFLGRVPTNIDYRKKSGTLILSSLLEDLVVDKEDFIVAQA